MNEKANSLTKAPQLMNSCAPVWYFLQVDLEHPKQILSILKETMTYLTLYLHLITQYILHVRHLELDTGASKDPLPTSPTPTDILQSGLHASHSYNVVSNSVSSGYSLLTTCAKQPCSSSSLILRFGFVFFFFKLEGSFQSTDLFYLWSLNDKAFPTC